MDLTLENSLINSPVTLAIVIQFGLGKSSLKNKMVHGRGTLVHGLTDVVSHQCNRW